MELPKVYNPKDFEDKIYEQWLATGYFNPDNLPVADNAPSYTIVFPPPNITDKLHMGHAATVALEDVMIRYHRMLGERALWVPGTDHAAIATQNVVEKRIWKDEHKTRHDYGREKFLEKIWDFLKTTQSMILYQTRKLGASMDWGREAFTMDVPRAKAVRTMFAQMYNEGIIYQGERIVNWCPRCKSTLADDELEYQEQKAKFYTFKYSKDFPFSISTTRPETKLGDTAVAVNPKDERYSKYIGQTFEVDFAGVPLKIKVIADWHVEMEFGTGALGVTPAHSMVDWQMAEANQLPIIKVINEDGQIHEGIGRYSGLSVTEARELVVESLREQGLLEKEEEITNNLSVCYRCSTPVEPLPSKQWFISVDKKIARLGDKSLKERSIEAAEAGEIKFIPERFKKRFIDWMTNLHDWCISRQIWFGHRIPVWYCADCDAKTVTDVAETKFIFARHGEAKFNTLGLLNSDINNLDNKLTEHGISQAKALGERLKKGVGSGAVHIYCSDFVRTKETAKLVAEEFCGVEIVEDARLREVGVGDFEGKTNEEYATLHDTDFELWHRKNPSNIESFEQLKNRVFSFIDEINLKHAGETVLVITHGDVIRVAQGYQTNLSDEDIFKKGYPHTGEAVNLSFIPATCACGSKHLYQDPDSLDTWFSSGTWTFSTLGWPDNFQNGKKSGDLARFHPTQVLETGYEIITLWVSRMIMMSLFAVEEIPFEKVYLHGMVLDKHGKKMSKSKGNGIDPLDVIEQFGTDAARLSLLIGNTPGNDMRLPEEKIEGFRNFVNKLWNVSRFILGEEEIGERSPRFGIRVEAGRSGDQEIDGPNSKVIKQNGARLADRWILSKFNRLKATIKTMMDEYNFAEAGDLLREFTWNDFADWYLECVKNESKGKKENLKNILEELLKMWHPFAPFVTQAIWNELGAKEELLIAKWPVADESLYDEAAENDFARLQEIIGRVRNLRAEYKVEPAKRVPAIFNATDKLLELMQANIENIKALARLESIEFATTKPEQTAVAVLDGLEIYLPLAGLLDMEKEKERLQKEQANLETFVATLTAKLSNADFVEHAPAVVVEKEREKLREAEEKLAKVRSSL